MSRKPHTHRVALLCGASLLAVSALTPTLALAQDGSPVGSDDAAEVDEVVVTGIRAQLRSAQAIKQNSEVIVDSVTAVDIGALPDRSVSEALQRISGVTLQRTNAARDPARLAAEGGGVFVRGLSWVRSETNGRDIFSASSGRGLSFEDVSADLLAGVDVYKNVAANMIEGGIAGTINLRTRVPFDNTERLLAVNADYNYGDLSERGFWSGSVIASDRWDTGIGEIGLLANVSISNVGNRTDSISVDRYDPVVLNAGNAPSDGSAADGDTVYIPKYLGWRTIDWEQKRTAVAIAAQWRPNDSLLFTLQALGSQADQYNVEYALGTESVLNPNSSYRYNNEDVFTYGDIPDANWNTDTRVGDDTKKTADVSLRFDYTPNSAWRFSGDLQYVKSTAEIYSLTAFTQLADRPDLTIDIGGDLPTVTSTGGSQTDASQYWWAAAMDHIEDNEADEKAGRLDTTYDFGDDNFFRTVSFGVRATEKDYTNRQTGYNWNLLSNQYWGNGGGAVVYLDDSSLDPRLADASVLYSFDNFFRGDAPVPGVAWFPAESLLNQGTAYAYDILKNTETSGWGWVPLSDDYESYRLGGGNGGITELVEKTEAAYIYGRFGSDNGPFGLSFDGNVGLRVVQTETNTNTVTTLPVIQGLCPPIATPGADCTAFNQAMQFANGGSLDGQDVSTSYTNYLPSLNVRVFVQDNLQVRFAASQAMVRPEMYQLQPFTNLSINFLADGYTLDPTTPYTGTGGNPGLRPIKSDNYDISAEWYFAPTGSLTLAVFHKDISDYIFTGTQTVSFTNGGVTYPFEITRYTNGDEGTVDGMELAYQQFYDFLPGPFAGLGLQGNFTYINSDGGRNGSQNILDPLQNDGASDSSLPLEGMSRTSYNIAALYEMYGISARLAYNWREEYLLTTSAANINAPVWASDYGQLDGSIFYNLTEDVKIGLQSTNILNERTVLKVGSETRKPPYNWVDTDRRVAIVLRASF